MRSSSQFFAPGKLFLAGEYAVLSPLGKAILMPTKLGILVKATFRKRFRIRNQNFPQENQSYLSPSDIRNQKIRLAVEVSRIYCQAQGRLWQPFSLRILSTISSEKEKYGLGSSGAIVVATIGAILRLYEVDYTPLDLFKLAVKATIHTEKQSSFADVAVSSFKQAIRYKRFSELAKTHIQTQFTPSLIAQTWDGLVIEPLTIKPSITVIYSGVSSPSGPLIERAQAVLDETWIQQSNTLVEAWLKASSDVPFSRILEHLIVLDSRGQIGMFPASIQHILMWAKKHHLDIKTSGAGGGDCLLVQHGEATISEALKNLPQPARVLSDIIAL